MAPRRPELSAPGDRDPPKPKATHRLLAGRVGAVAEAAADHVGERHRRGRRSGHQPATPGIKPRSILLSIAFRYKDSKIRG